MVQSISVQPNEKGTAKVTITPTDEDENTLEFADLTDPVWQLMKEDGTVVNNRTFANCTMTSLSFILSGDDLVMFGSGDSGLRYLSFHATYDSTLGNDLPLVAEATFIITAVLGQTDV
jgi:hypothetical protein